MDPKKFEWNRQVFHLILGVVIVAIIMYKLLDKTLLLAIVLSGVILSYISRKIKIPVIYWFLERFERKEDLKKFPGKGTLFYFIGSFISLLLFPEDIALASIIILALGDSVSHIYGITYGKTRHFLSRTKFLEGTIAGFITGFLGAMIFIPWHEALLASLFAMIVESVDIRIKAHQFDDNLLIPIASGAVVWLLRFITA